MRSKDELDHWLAEFLADLGADAADVVDPHLSEIVEQAAEAPARADEVARLQTWGDDALARVGELQDERRLLKARAESAEARMERLAAELKASRDIQGAEKAILIAEIAKNAALVAECAALREAGVGARITIEALFSDEGRDPGNNDNYCRLVDALASPSQTVLRVEAAVKLAEASCEFDAAERSWRAVDYTKTATAEAYAHITECATRMSGATRNFGKALAAFRAADAACKAPKGAERENP